MTIDIDLGDPGLGQVRRGGLQRRRDRHAGRAGRERPQEVAPVKALLKA